MNKLREAARQVVANGVQGTYAKYYSVPPADFEALREALAEQAEQEPVAEVVVRPLRGDQSQPTTDIKWLQKPTTGKLYTHPVRTKDLTDDEIDEVRNKTWCLNNSLREFARAVIAADREKNK